MQTEDRADENMALQKPSFSPILYWLCSLCYQKHWAHRKTAILCIYSVSLCFQLGNSSTHLFFYMLCFHLASEWPLRAASRNSTELFQCLLFSCLPSQTVPSNQYSYAFFILASFVNHEAILGYLLMEDVLQSLMWLPVNLFLPAVSDFSEVLVATQATCCPFHWLLLAALLLRHGSMCVEEKHRVCQIQCASMQDWPVPSLWLHAVAA